MNTFDASTKAHSVNCTIAQICKISAFNESHSTVRDITWSAVVGNRLIFFNSSILVGKTT